MTFIHHHKVKSNLWKIDSFPRDHAIARYKNTSLFLKYFDLLLACSAFFIIKLHDIVNILAPLAQLGLPIDFHGRWHDNQYFPYLLCIKQAFEECGDLYSFAKTHIIAQNTALFALVQLVKPLDTQALMDK